ncbi:MoaD/ThiS family protein [Thermodesulfobacteriota bacterium]
MIKIKLRLSSWVTAKLGVEHSGWLTLEEEVGEGSNISDLLAGMVTTYPGLREAVNSPDTGVVDARINVSLNDQLLDSREISRAKLSNGDTIILFPSCWGG